MSRQAIKRQILDALDEGHKFDVPQQLVDAEFDTIWQRVKHEVENHGSSFEDEGTTEEAAKEQYRKIAERRVRLGLVVAEIGNDNKVEVTEDEHQQALIAEVRRFPGQEQQVYDYYRKNPQALAALRAPVYENKVVDFVAEQAEADRQADDPRRSSARSSRPTTRSRRSITTTTTITRATTTRDTITDHRSRI